MGVIGKVAKVIANRVRYGKKIRVNYTNGNQVYKRGKVETTLSQEGKLLSKETTTHSKPLFGEEVTNRYKVEFTQDGKKNTTETVIFKNNNKFIRADVVKGSGDYNSNNFPRTQRRYGMMYNQDGSQTIKKISKDKLEPEYIPFPKLNTKM